MGQAALQEGEQEWQETERGGLWAGNGPQRIMTKKEPGGLQRGPMAALATTSEFDMGPWAMSGDVDVRTNMLRGPTQERQKKGQGGAGARTYIC